MSAQIVFLLLVFGAVVLLSQSFLVSVYSPQRANIKRLKKHLNSMAESDNHEEKDLMLTSRLDKLPPFTRWLESQPFIANFTYKLELAGSKVMGHQYLLLVILVTVAAALAVWIPSKDITFTLMTGGLVMIAFFIKLKKSVDKRMEAIEGQFPEALDVLKRGLQAGYAFSDAIKLVFEEMDGPLADEFKIMFNRINFGNDVKTALLHFIKRVPSASAMAFCSAVAIQKETGGNLAENIENLSKIIRQRFTFKRRVRTLSAEGRLSGWVLVLMPFILFAVLYLTSPGYVASLTASPEGLSLLKWGGAGMLLGIWWINKLIQIEV